MTSPLRMAILGGAAVLALSMDMAGAEAQTTTTTTVVHGDSPDGDHWGDHGGDHWGGDHGDMRRGPGEHGWGGPRGGEHDRGDHDRGEHAAEHLRTMLQLTPAQEPALKAFLASMAPPPMTSRHVHEGKPGESMRPAGASPTDPAARKAEMDKRMTEMAMTTPQRLDAMVKKMAERQADMQARVNAVKTFYAALTPSQQKVFDTLHGGMMGHGGMDGRMRHGGPGERGPHGHEMHMAMGRMAPMPPSDGR